MKDREKEEMVTKEQKEELDRLFLTRQFVVSEKDLENVATLNSLKLDEKYGEDFDILKFSFKNMNKRKG